MALSNNNGQIVEQYTYDEFGNTTGGSSVGNPYRFTAREWDSESGLYYYRARYYKPSIGRFLQTVSDVNYILPSYRGLFFAQGYYSLLANLRCTLPAIYASGLTPKPGTALTS